MIQLNRKPTLHMVTRQRQLRRTCQPHQTPWYQSMSSLQVRALRLSPFCFIEEFLIRDYHNVLGFWLQICSRLSIDNGTVSLTRRLGYKLMMVLIIVTLVSFIMLLDTSIVVTVCYCKLSWLEHQLNNRGLSQESQVTSTLWVRHTSSRNMSLEFSASQAIP